MAYTLNNIASDKLNQAAKRGDAIRVHISAIKIIDGFNVRDDDDDLREHVASLLAAMVAGQPIPPVEVWVNPESGAIEMVEGHCRHIAYGQYAEINPAWDGYVSAVPFNGTPFQRKMRIASSNKQLKLKPVELGRLYLHARDVLGASRQEIAAEAGMSLAHVDQMILLASAKPEVIAAIDAGKISATEAVKLTREHGDGAAEELERRQEAAKAAGKEKVTAKTAAPKPPSRPRVDMVVSNAVVLVNSLKPDLEERISSGAAGFSDCGNIDPMILADLIMAVREMQQAGKPLDADKQMELIGDEG